MLILDRSFDYTGPLIHDYSYWSLFFEILHGKAVNALKDKEALTSKVFTENDDYWQVYKTMNMAEA